MTTERKLLIPVYTKVFTSEEEGFVSEDEEVLNRLRFLSKHFKKGNIRTFGRGFDYNQFSFSSPYLAPGLFLKNGETQKIFMY